MLQDWSNNRDHAVSGVWLFAQAGKVYSLGCAQERMYEALRHKAGDGLKLSTEPKQKSKHVINNYNQENRQQTSKHQI